MNFTRKMKVDFDFLYFSGSVIIDLTQNNHISLTFISLLCH